MLLSALKGENNRKNMKYYMTRVLMTVLCKRKMLGEVLVLIALAILGYCDPETLSQGMIDYINGLGTTWKAEPNFIGKDEEYVHCPCGALEGKIPPVDAIPDEVDSRKNWPQCKTIGDIHDQADCGSCWVWRKNAIILLHNNCSRDRHLVQWKPRVIDTGLLLACK